MALSWAAANFLAFAGAAAELQCVGRLAHEAVLSDGDWEAGQAWLSVRPAPEHDGDCATPPDSHGDRHVCVGANVDQTCKAAKAHMLPMPDGARCQDCFLGTSTDVYYSLNISRRHVQLAGFGFRGTKVESQLSVADDQGWAGKPRQGNRTFLEEPYVIKLGVKGLELDLKVSMPTDIHYFMQGRGGEHGDVGARILLNLGDHYVEYVHGQGWTHHRSEPTVSVSSVHEGDFNDQLNLTVGVTSSLRAELGGFMWANLDIRQDVPMFFTSVKPGGRDYIHNCYDVSSRFDLSHEAGIHVALANRTILEKHFGPVVDRHREGKVAHNCSDLHPPAATVVV